MITQADREAAERFDAALATRLSGTQLHNLAGVLAAHRIEGARAAIAAIHQSTEAARIEGAKAMREAAYQAIISLDVPDPSCDWISGALDAAEAIRSLDPHMSGEEGAEIGSGKDERHKAIENAILAYQDGRPRLRVVEDEPEA